MKLSVIKNAETTVKKQMIFITYFLNVTLNPDDQKYVSILIQGKDPSRLEGRRRLQV